MKIFLKLFLIASLLAIRFHALTQPAPPAGYKWKIVEEDNFTSSTLNTAMWGLGSTPWGSENQSSCNLIPAEDTYISGGSLVLRARSGSFKKSDGTLFPYSSGWAWTKTWRTYGYIEIRAQYPNQRGAWPAFWMLGNGWPPEFDIAEFRGVPKNYMTMAFYDGTWTTNTKTADYTGWHTYGLEWAAGSLKWYIDGVVVKTHTGNTVPSQSMYVILSNGTDCTDGNGTGFPSYFNVDYLRWYQTAPADVTSGQTYQIIARNSGLALDASGTTDKSPVWVYSYWGGANQKWTVQSTSAGYYKITNVASGRVLDAKGTTNDSPCIVYSYWGGNNQHWLINNLGNGYYSIINKASGRSLNISGITNNSIATIYDYSSTQGQQFQFNLLPATGARVTDAETISVAEEKIPDGVVVYPNPSSLGNFSVKFPVGFKVNVKVYDEQGKLICEQVAEGGQLQINRSLPVGVYNVEVSSNEFSINRKLVID